jgi:hypothetical protein
MIASLAILDIGEGPAGSAEGACAAANFAFCSFFLAAITLAALNASFKRLARASSSSNSSLLRSSSTLKRSRLCRRPARNASHLHHETVQKTLITPAQMEHNNMKGCAYF